MRLSPTVGYQCQGPQDPQGSKIDGVPLPGGRETGWLISFAGGLDGPLRDLPQEELRRPGTRARGAGRLRAGGRSERNVVKVGGIAQVWTLFGRSCGRPLVVAPSGRSPVATE
jgi:hypothetical protein